MKITSDKRHEVAARLREYSNDVLKDGSLLKTLKDVTGAGSWRYVLDSLADLIDPTCQEVPMESVGRWPFYTGIDLHLEMVSYGCSVCGYPWGEIDKWATHGAGWHNSPKYCPNCGRRVVKGMMK